MDSDGDDDWQVQPDFGYPSFDEVAKSDDDAKLATTSDHHLEEETDAVQGLDYKNQVCAAAPPVPMRMTDDLSLIHI